MKSGIIKRLFVDYSTELKKYVSLKFGVEQAEDIVQDAFHNFLKHDSPASIENPRAYLYQSVRNLALNRIRKSQCHEGYLEEQDLEEQETRSPERYVTAQYELDEVQKKLTKLPDKCRRAFVLSRVHHKTYPEIATELDVSVSSVEKYLINALTFLRESIEDSKGDRCL